MVPTLVLSVIMAIAVIIAGQYIENIYLKFIIQICIGGVLYFILSVLSGNSSYLYLSVSAKQIIRNRKERVNECVMK